MSYQKLLLLTYVHLRTSMYLLLLIMSILSISLLVQSLCTVRTVEKGVSRKVWNYIATLN